MLETVSPYALLRASIPKKSGGAATAYDLYSLAQTDQAVEAPPVFDPPAPQTVPEETPAPAAEAPSPSAPRPMPSTVPTRRTHYISDIQSRHSAAANRTSFVTLKG